MKAKGLVIIFILTLFHGCAAYNKMVLPLDMRVSKLHGAARPQEAVKEFFEEEKVEEAYLSDLYAVIGSFLVTHDFANADKAIKAIIKDGDQTDKRVAIGQTYQGNFYFTLGDYKKAKEVTLLNIKHEDQDFPLSEYRILGTLAAKEGKHKEAKKWMAEIEKLEYKVLFFSLGREMIGKLKKDARARILLAMGDAKGAQVELNRAMPGKSFGDYIFEYALNYTKTDFDRKIERVEKWIAPKDIGDWPILFDIQVLALYAQVSLANKNYPHAIQSLRRLLSYPNIDQNRIFYTRALVDLSLAYTGAGDKKAALKFKKLAMIAIEEDMKLIPWKEQKKRFKSTFKFK